MAPGGDGHDEGGRAPCQHCWTSSSAMWRSCPLPQPLLDPLQFPLAYPLPHPLP
jgi:hypothetical protein